MSATEAAGMLTRLAAVAALFMALAVVFGAFGAHALRDRVEPALLLVWEKAVLYHLARALGMLLVLGLAGRLIDEAQAVKVVFLLLIGVLLFSGSLYALVLSGVKILGAITPLGGTAFIAAWLYLAVVLARR